MTALLIVEREGHLWCFFHSFFWHQLFFLFFIFRVDICYSQYICFHCNLIFIVLVSFSPDTTRELWETSDFYSWRKKHCIAWITAWSVHLRASALNFCLHQLLSQLTLWNVWQGTAGVSWNVSAVTGWRHRCKPAYCVAENEGRRASHSAQ